MGINITPNLDNLFEENYTLVGHKIQSHLLTWSSLPLSLSGRINIIRMNVFQMLPCYYLWNFLNN